MKIYLASSWRNPEQEQVLKALRGVGYAVYDFKNPCDCDKGFSWKDVGLRGDFTYAEYRAALLHPVANVGFENDFRAMQWADICVMLLPCGRSAHLEVGWFIGAGKPCYIVGEVK